MTALHPSIPLALLALGFADIVYINLSAAPAYLAERARAARAAEPFGAGATAPDEPTLAAEPILAADPTLAPDPIPAPAEPTLAPDPIPAPAEPLAPTAGEAAAAAVPAARSRALDPQLSTQTGAELEPERRPARGLDRETLGLPDPDVTVPAEEALPPIHIQFPESHTDLDDGARARLDRVARALAAGRSRRAIIEGHSDGRGRLAHNEELSQRRADKVAAYLESRGVDRSRMTVRSFGQRRPLDRGAGADADRRNRRVDVRVTGAGSGVER